MKQKPNYIPQQLIVIDIYGSGYGVLVDSRCGKEKVWFSWSGKACVPNRKKVNDIIEKIKREKNPKIEVIEHYWGGRENYLPSNVENRKIL